MRRKHAHEQLARCNRSLQQQVEMASTVYRLFSEASVSDIGIARLLLLHKHGLAEAADELLQLQRRLAERT